MSSIAQKEPINNTETYLKKIESCYKRIQFYDMKYARFSEDEDLKQLIRCNKNLVSIIESNNLLKIGNADLKKISMLTGIKIIHNKDKNLTGLSWSILNNTPEPEYTSFLLLNGKSIKIISQHGTGDREFGENLGLDSIIERTMANKKYFFLIRSGKCGNICIQKSIRLFSIYGKSINECSNAFFDGIQYSSCIVFQYFLSDEIKIEPSFEVKSKEIGSPTFGDNKLVKTGVKKYRINYCL